MTAPSVQTPAAAGPDGAPRFSTADALSLEALTALWNRAYEAYLVPLHFTPDMLGRHIARAGADLALSRVLCLGEPAGVSLVARSGPRAYLAGFGIVAAHRRGGWGHRLLGEQLVALQAAGVTGVQLEVIESNPARRLYAQAGFVQTRGLAVLQGRLDRLDLQGAAPALRSPEPARLQALHGQAHPTAPTWRRQWHRLAPMLSQPGVLALALDDRAYAIVSEGPEMLGLVDAGALDEASAGDLLQALEARYPGRSWRLVDEPEDTPLHAAARRAGLTLLLRQVEMHAPLP